jgi:secondary thiamine-phosphate synthase enzyme
VKQFTHRVEIRTRGKGFHPFTGDVAKWVAARGIGTGLLTLFCQHTSASLVIQENADPDVALDLADYFERIAPEDDSALPAHDRGLGRYAGAHPDGADADASCDSGGRR